MIGLFKETIHRIEKGDYDQSKYKECWPGWYKLSAWKQLINMEARCPFLEPELHEDLKTCAQVIVECAKKFPEEKIDYDYDYDWNIPLELVKTLAPSHSELAKTLIPCFQTSRFQFEGLIEIFRGESKLEGYDIEKGFAELEVSYKNAFANDGYHSILLFCAAMDHLGMDQATQFIKRAKYLMEQSSHEPHKFGLCKAILQAEVKYSLESRQDTLKALYAIGKGPEIDLSGALEMIIDAELSFFSSA